MIYTDIKQAIGNTLLEVREYKGGDYNWRVTIFNNGIIVYLYSSIYGSNGRSDNPTATKIKTITEICTPMPEELKELINKHK